MVRSKANKSKRESPGPEKKLHSALSTPEVKRKAHHSDVLAESDSDVENATEKQYQDSFNTDTRRRIVSECNEEIRDEKCEAERFPGRRRSIHLSKGEVTSCQESLKETICEKRHSLHSMIVGTKVSLNKKNNLRIIAGQCCKYIIYIFLFLFILKLFFDTIHVGKLETSLTLDSIKQKFPKQEDLLWKAITSGLNDTLKLEFPSSYILIHEGEAVNTVKKLIKSLSQYAVCLLSNCNNIPIELNSKVLDYPVSVDNSDYGVIISKYKKDLENIGVMVIENLDEIPEKYALAFHSFCDQVSPLVKKSVFFFTVKVDKLEESQLYDLRNVEKLLRNKWKHIDDDVFQPLFTRLSAMLIRIYPE